jgi:outer membrane protein TolC
MTGLRTRTPSLSALVGAALLAVAAAPSGRAGADAPPARAVTLAQARAALAGSPAHRAASLRSRAAGDAVDAAGAWPGFGLGVATTLHTARAIVTSTVPLPVFGTIGASRDAARAELDGARAEEDALALEQRQRATAAWIELARTEARSALAARIAEGTGRLAEIARRRQDAGDAARAEVLIAETAALRARADDRNARLAVEIASVELAALLAWDPDVPLHAEPGLPPPDAAVPAGALPDGRGHPEARAAAARVAAEAAHVAQAHRARFPQLGLELEADIDDPTLPGTDLRAGLRLDVPLLGRGGDAERAADGRRRAAELERDATVQRLRARVAAAARRARAAAARSRTLGDEVVPAERDTAALVRTAYREGQARLVDVLAADRALADVELEAVDAQAEAAAAVAELEQALGAP